MATTRNERCPCGSGKRHKDCCGKIQPAEAAGEPTDDELLRHLIEEDEDAFARGESPRRRDFENVRRVLAKVRPGMIYVLCGGPQPEIVQRIHRLSRELYRLDDVAISGVHMGAFMFRDLFARVRVPLAYGTVRLDPLELIDLSDFQKQWLRSRAEDYLRLGDQFIDICDFGYGATELGHRRPIGQQAETLLGLARFHFQAAAATITVAYDLGGAVQSALLGTELALKAGLAANEFTEDQLKREYGHDLPKAALELGARESGFDTERVLRVVTTFPAYVPNRYSREQPGRIEAGHIVMGAQYVAAEVTRQLTDRNLRRGGGMSEPRRYPE